MEQVLWAATGSEAMQKALWAALDRRPGENVILATRHGFHGKKGLAGAVTGSESDPERDPRVRFISFPTDECQSIERRRQPLDLAPYRDRAGGAGRRARRADLLPDHRAVPGRRRIVSSAEGIPATARAFLPRARHRLHSRRSAGQLRPHRLAVRLHALRRRARHRRPGQGAGQRRAGRRRGRPGRPVRQHALRRRLRHLERLAPGAAPPCWPRSTSSRPPDVLRARAANWRR